MLTIEKAYPEDISRITDISIAVFSHEADSAPEGYRNQEWYFNITNTGYLFKIQFNGEIIGGFVAFKTSQLNFQLDRIFILPEYQNLGIGKKAVNYAFKRFPEATVWYTDVKSQWKKYSSFLVRCGFFESSFSAGSSVRYIKLLNKRN